jgi:uncharacterized membrane protein YdbT with pleckstrin-like domain
VARLRPRIRRDFEQDQPQRFDEQAEEDDDTVLETGPSMWTIASELFTAAAVFAAGVWLMAYPLEKLIFENTESTAAAVTGKWRVLIGAIAGLLAVLWGAYKVLHLKSILYIVSEDRIEWVRGVFNEKIDSLDMFRITDIYLERSLLDKILGIGSVVLVSNDETDPEFVFEKIADPKDVYDTIKRIHLDADQRRRVVHVD